jgi:hypothetical protein
MIHFDFIVSDEDAQTIFDAINEHIEEARYEMTFGLMNNREWYRGRITYLEELKAKMTNTKIS